MSVVGPHRRLCALGPAVARRAGHLAKGRAATIRAALVNLAGRAARHGRDRITLRLPQNWQRGREWLNLWETCGPPAAAA
jgi:hypothetical protein